MSYFTQEYLDFFANLRENNSKAFFDENRKHYEEFVKKPFKNFVSELLVKTQEIDSDIVMETKNAIFRINRDIRFSHDKTPYKSYMSAGFAKEGRKSDYAGFYIAISNKSIYIGGGSWGMNKSAVNAVRNEISYNTEEFLKIIQNKEFRKIYGGLKGESMKRIPKDYKDTFEIAPDIARKSFHYMQEYQTPEIILEDDFMDYVLSHYKIAMPLNRFMKRALD